MGLRGKIGANSLTLIRYTHTSTKTQPYIWIDRYIDTYIHTHA